MFKIKNLNLYHIDRFINMKIDNLFNIFIIFLSNIRFCYL